VAVSLAHLPVEFSPCNICVAVSEDDFICGVVAKGRGVREIEAPVGYTEGSLFSPTGGGDGVIGASESAGDCVGTGDGVFGVSESAGDCVGTGDGVIGASEGRREVIG
jgi:hypothetical protein